MPRGETTKENMANWTPELIAQLTKLWDEGHSTAEIGRRMGLTKNKVIGKAHRLNLTPRPSPLKRPSPRQHTAPRAAATGECSWPVGHPGDKDFGFCGKRTMPGRPYCQDHAKMAYVKPRAPAMEGTNSKTKGLTDLSRPVALGRRGAS